MRIGYFGGSFDPIHGGHLALAREIVESPRLDRLGFLVAARPPHKPDRELTDGAHRVAMIEAAIEGDERLFVDARELDRDGPSWSVVSMEEIATERPGDDIHFIIGADNLPDLPRWKRFDDLARLVTFMVVERPGAPAIDPRLVARIRAVRVESKPWDVSSTEIRRRVREGEPFADLVPEPVARYIGDHGLYRGSGRA